MRNLGTIAIVNKPGSFQEGLRALLTALLQVERVERVSDAQSARAVIAIDCSALVLLETDLPSEAALAALMEIKAGWPEVQCLALASDSPQPRAAEAAGAEAVLLKGTAAAELSIAVVEVLAPV